MCRSKSRFRIVHKELNAPELLYTFSLVTLGNKDCLLRDFADEICLLNLSLFSELHNILCLVQAYP